VIAHWIGLLRAMVFTHLPGNALVLLVPLMPSLELAIAAWLARSVFAQMERPPRQSYAMAIIAADERAAALGLMEVARTVLAAVAPGIAGATLAVSALGLPFLLAGGLKIAYDLTRLFVFRDRRPPGEETS
jgi:sugar phosphate permease